MKGEFIEELFKMLCEEGVYRVHENTWNLKVKGPSSPTSRESDEKERGIASLFETIVRFVDAVPAGPGWHLDAWGLRPRKWVAHGLQLINRRRKSDIVLFGDTDASIPTLWADVVSSGEIKYQDTGHLAKQACKQVYTRDRSFEINSIDIHEEPTAFLRFVVVLTFGGPRWLGYDPNFHIFNERIRIRFRGVWVLSILFHSRGIQGRGTRILAVVRDGHYLVLKDSWIAHHMPTDGNVHELLQDKQRNGIAEQDDAIRKNLMDLRFLDAAHAYLIDSEKNLQYVMLLGMEQSQGTTNHYLTQSARIALGGHPLEKENVFRLPKLLKDDHLLDKDACDVLTAQLQHKAFQEQHADGSDGWDLTSPRWDGEEHLYGVPIYDSEEKIMDVGGIGDLLRLLAVQNPRTHVRTTFHTCAVGITWFSCVREFFNGILGAVIGHRNGYLHRGVLHCDVSDTNIWMRIRKALPEFAVPEWPIDKPGDWYPKRSGMAGDWGFGRDKTLPVSDDKVYLTGTFPFQAAELLSPSDTAVQGVHHDLESFFWLIWIICVNLTGPFDRRVTWIPQEEPLYASANASGVCEQFSSSTGNRGTQGRGGRSSASRREGGTEVEKEEIARQVAIPRWAKPGGQGLDCVVVAREKKDVKAATLDLISPYFKKHEAVLYGIRRLYRLFRWQDTSEPPNPVTHVAFLAILHGIIEGIKPEDDPRPSDADIKEARERYTRLLRRRVVETPILAGSRSTSLSPSANTSHTRPTTRRSSQRELKKRRLYESGQEAVS